MSKPTPTLKAQALAVERVAMNHRNFIYTLRGLVDHHKRPPHELKQWESWFPDLEAAAQTMARLAKEESQ